MALQGKKHQIFRIISALQPTEKAYIRKFAFKTEKAGTLSFALFDVMEKALRKEAEPQEAVIVKAFSKLHPEADYVKVKARLLEIIGDALVDYDKLSSRLASLFDYFQLAESYLKRKLVHDAVQVLRKAEKLAKEQDETELLIRAKVHRLMAEAYVTKFDKEGLKKSAYSSVFEDIALLQRKTLVRDSAQKMHHFQKHIGLPRSEEDLRLLEEISNGPGLQIPADQLDLTGGIDQTLTRCILYFSNNEFDKVIEACSRFLAIGNRPEKGNRILQNRMIALYDSYMQACLMSRNTLEFERAYAEFSEMESQHPEVLRLKAGVDLYARCVSSFYFEKFEAFEQLNTDFEVLCKDELIPNYRKVSMGYFIAHGLFSAEHWQLSAKRIHWIFQQKDFSIRYDIDSALRLMNLLILAEQKDWFHLEYALRSWSEWLDSRERKFEIEQHLLRFLRKISIQTESDVRESLYSELIDSLTAVTQGNAEEAQFLRAFDVLNWAKSHFQKRVI